MSSIGHNSQASNWIALSRDMASHWLVGFGQPVKPVNPSRGSHSRAEAWIDLIMLARWKSGAEVNKGRKVEMEIGQLQGGYSFLALRWNWTVKQVRAFLDKLIAETMIQKGQPFAESEASEEASKKGKQQGNQVQVITLCNYKKYQIAAEVDEMLEGQAKGKPRASEGQHLNKETRIQEDKGTNVPSSSDQLSLVPDDAPMTASRAAREAYALYQETADRCGLPKARTLDKERAKALALRVKDAGGMDGFRQAMANIERSAFLRGMTEKEFKADLNFVCQRKSFIRLIEGGYGNGAHAGSGSSGPPAAYDKFYQGVL